jgi:hypothetical protein
MGDARTPIAPRQSTAALTRGWPLSGTLVASAAAVAVVAAAVLWGAGGWEYYRTPLTVRAYAPAHRILRPSGLVGHTLGIAGLAMMLVPLAYAARKKWRRLSRFGSMKTWLDVHIFCGIVGPVLVTFHSALKFNGVISVAYWSMVAVMLSGFVGRYLYVRMPRSIRGVELSYEEIVARAGTLQEALGALGLPAALAERLQAAGDAASDGPVRRHVRLRAIRRAMTACGIQPVVVREAVELSGARASLLRRLAYLKRTRQLFALWHVFHQPLVYVMLAIVIVHIGVALYLGYAFFLQ